MSYGNILAMLSTSAKHPRNLIIPLKQLIFRLAAVCAPVALFSWVDVCNLKERQQPKEANLVNLDRLEINYAKEIRYHP